jgi:hypothetical protein
MDTNPERGNRVLRQLRRLLLGVLAVGFIGTAVDLTFLAHYEDPLQLAPFMVIAFCVLSIAWHGIAPGGFSLALMRIAMTVAVAAAAVGMTLHYQGSMEFQLEMDRSLTGFELMKKVLTAKAPPTMAPLNLALLGLVGLTSTFREKPEDL